MRKKAERRQGVLVVAAAFTALLLATGPAWAARVPNGDFETGTLSGFFRADQPGGSGSWYAYGTGKPLPPPCGNALGPPPQGNFAASTSQSGPGSHVLYRNVALERNARHRLAFTLYYRNFAVDGFATPNTLSYTPFTRHNQQYRVDILKPSADPFSVSQGDVLATIFRTDPGEPNTLGPTRITYNLTPYAGRTVRLRFAEVDNHDNFCAAVDNIKVRTRGQPRPDDCTIHGTPGNDILRGTSRADVICGGGGDDIVYGLGGNDTLRGGGGNDILRGGAGDDRLAGGAGNDQLIGGAGGDRLTGGSGRDVLSGQDGSDFLDSRDGVSANDTLNGGEGADTCRRDPGDVATSC